ncbi:peptide-binding protein [candidate division CSSED10-310 bacterium]|uniref:Peptide-binding protein n=1 Tax=candidate division CSSED10-310 bacterium TaxID=2855610 RepID=A0ABV6Z6F8_UNCC1
MLRHHLIKGETANSGRGKIWLMGLLFLQTIFFISHCGKPEQGKVSPPKPASEKKIDSHSLGQKDTLVRALSTSPQYLNPVLSSDTTSSSVEELVFDPMVAIDGSPDSNLVGRLAEKWDISPDKLTIIFHLRPGIRWHDGEPFTAEDVKFTFDVAMRKDVPAIGMQSSIEPLQKIEIIDTHKIAFHFRYPFSPGLLGIGSTLIVPKHRLDDQGLVLEAKRRASDEPVTFLTSGFNRNPIGTGPYIFKEWKTAQRIRLRRNENYWDKVHFPKIRTVLFKIIPSSTVAFNIMQKGELDVMSMRPVQYLRFKRLENLHQDFEAVKFYTPSLTYIAWNMRPGRKFFQDVRVRQAMTHAIDRTAFIEKIKFGLGRTVSGPFYFKSWANDPSIEPLAFDLEKAASLLKEAGWTDNDGDGLLDKNGVKFEFELLIYSESATYAQLASIIQANLKQLSLEVKISVYEWSVYLERYRHGEFDACIGRWSFGVDPDQYGLWHSSQVDLGNNYIGYRNEVVDKLLEDGRREFNREERQKIYWKIHEILHHDQPYTFFYSFMETYILSVRIKNYQVSPFGLFQFFPGQSSWTLK